MNPKNKNESIASKPHTFDSRHEDYSRIFYAMRAITIGLVIILALFGIVYFTYSSLINPIYTLENNRLYIAINDHCYLVVANLFNLLVIATGTAAAIFLSIGVQYKAWKYENYLIALLLFLGFLIYEIIDYDPIYTKWQHPCPLCGGVVPAQKK